MKLHYLVLHFLSILSSASITGVAADLCLGSCGTNEAGNKECTFNVRVDLFASERGFYYFDECEGTNPTLGEYRNAHDAGVDLQKCSRNVCAT